MEKKQESIHDPEQKEFKEAGSLAQEIIHNVLEEQFAIFFKPHEMLDGQTAIPCIWERGNGRVVLVLGDNGSGKSFFRRLIEATCQRAMTTSFGAQRKAGKFPSHVATHSPEDRMGIDIEFRSFKFGDESIHSTGENSSKILKDQIETILKKCQEVGESHENVIAYFDEPDVGSGPRVSAGIGQQINTIARNAPEALKAIFITTHNPIVIRQLLENTAIKPHYIFLGDMNGPKTLEAWMEMQRSADIVPMSNEELTIITRQRRKDIQQLIGVMREEKKSKKNESSST